MVGNLLKLGDCVNRHLPRQHYHQSLEQQREAALFSSERDIRQTDSVTRALHPR